MKSINKKLKQIVFEILEGGAASVVDISWAMLATKSVSRKRLHMIGNNDVSLPGKKIVEGLKNAHSEYTKYHSFLKRLQKEGLVSVEGVHKSRFWGLTNKGRSELRQMKKQVRFNTEAIIPGGVTMISYDIPEKIRRERDSVREILKMFNFIQVHKSLWYANVTVTKKFVDYLREKKILDYVHIFEVSKHGTLEKVK